MPVSSSNSTEGTRLAIAPRPLRIQIVFSRFSFVGTGSGPGNASKFRQARGAYRGTRLSSEKLPVPCLRVDCVRGTLASLPREIRAPFRGLITVRLTQLILILGETSVELM
jgi:hypothetical protein